MSPLDLEHRLSAIETAIAVLSSQEKPLMDLVIDVLGGVGDHHIESHVACLTQLRLLPYGKSSAYSCGQLLSN